jgi:hypothetical protein
LPKFISQVPICFFVLFLVIMHVILVIVEMLV